MRDWTGPGFIAFMCVTGAIIAYIADRLGRFIGKKKRRLFGWRPQKTATFITTLSGFFIPMITIGVLFWSSAEVRRMITEGNLAASQLVLTTKDLSDRTKLLNQTEQRLKDAQKKMTDAQSQIQTASSQNKTLADKNKALSGQNKNASKQLIQFKTDLVSSKKQAEKAKHDLVDIKSNLSQIKGDFAKSKADFSTMRTSAEKYQRDLEQQNLQLVAEQKKLQDAIKGFEIQKANLTQQVEDLTTRLSNDAEAYRKEITDKRKELEDITGQLDEAKRTLGELRALTSQLNQVLGDTRSLPITYGIREELARWVVPPAQTEPEISQAIQKLLSQGSDRAAARGAVGTPAFQPASLFDILDVNNHVVLSVEEQKQRIQHSVAGLNDETLMILRSRINCFQGEFVRCVIEVHPNSIIYRKGEVIAETRINGSMSDQQIADAIQTFLQEDVSKAVVRKGIIPVVGSDAPLGEVESAAASQLIQNIRAFNRPVRVQAAAFDTTRAADRVRIEFRLR